MDTNKTNCGCVMLWKNIELLIVLVMFIIVFCSIFFNNCSRATIISSENESELCNGSDNVYQDTAHTVLNIQ